jgi:uncharacterized lipoprotein NlpE involved in copper resistance
MDKLFGSQAIKKPATFGAKWTTPPPGEATAVDRVAENISKQNSYPATIRILDKAGKELGSVTVNSEGELQKAAKDLEKHLPNGEMVSYEIPGVGVKAKTPVR